jgi:hypothetical protein
MDNDPTGRCTAAHRAAQRLERSRHGRQDGLGRLALHHPQAGVAAGKQEIHLQALLIAEVVQLALSTRSGPL